MFDVLFSRAAWSWIVGEISIFHIPLILVLLLLIILIASLIFDISKCLKAKQQHFSEQNNPKITETTEASDDEHSAFIWPGDINIPEEHVYDDTHTDIKAFKIKIFLTILLLVWFGTYLSKFPKEIFPVSMDFNCPRITIDYNTDAEKKLADSGIFDNLQYDFKFHIVDLPENIIEALKNNKLLKIKYNPDKKFVLYTVYYQRTREKGLPGVLGEPTYSAIENILVRAIKTAKNRPDNAEYFSFSRLPSIDRTFEWQSGETETISYVKNGTLISQTFEWKMEEPDFCSREGEDNKIYYAKFDLVIEVCNGFCILDLQTNRAFSSTAKAKEIADLLQTLLDYLKSNNL